MLFRSICVISSSMPFSARGIFSSWRGFPAIRSGFSSVPPSFVSALFSISVSALFSVQSQEARGAAVEAMQFVWREGAGADLQPLPSQVLHPNFHPHSSSLGPSTREAMSSCLTRSSICLANRVSALGLEGWGFFPVFTSAPSMTLLLPHLWLALPLIISL